MVSRKTRGFSLIEMMIVIALILVVTGFSIMALQPSLKAGHITQGYNTTLMALRQARDLAVAQRQIYFVTLTNAAVPNGLSITQGSTGNVVAVYALPSDVGYGTAINLPNSPNAFPTTPDGFGTAAFPIDFDQGVVGGVKNVIYFYPDGSAQDANGNINNGVVYMAVPPIYGTFRAITLWGATGRLRGWQLYQNAGQYYWRQM
jgi:prepilin-type N-terminal cleavage/methylation domain-containing protein